MLELADRMDLGSIAERRWGSSPHTRTIPVDAGIHGDFFYLTASGEVNSSGGSAAAGGCGPAETVLRKNPKRGSRPAGAESEPSPSPAIDTLKKMCIIKYKTDD